MYPIRLSAFIMDVPCRMVEEYLKEPLPGNVVIP